MLTLHTLASEQHAPLVWHTCVEHAVAPYHAPAQDASDACVHEPVPVQHAPIGGHVSGLHGWAGKNVQAHAAATLTTHPDGPQHAPCVFGHGLGVHGVLAANVEPNGQLDLATNTHPPACPGTQHAPVGPLHGLGLHATPGVKFPAIDAHSLWLIWMHVFARLQHAPAGTHGEVSHVAPPTNVLDAAQFAAVVLMHTFVVVLQHAPEGPQFAAAHVVFAYHEFAHADLTTNTHAVAEQHAPLGWHGPLPHAAPEVHVPAHAVCDTVVQSPAAEQHAPASTAFGHGLAVHDPPK